MTSPAVGIIGVGKLGAALWNVLEPAGIRVKGFDASAKRRADLAGDRAVSSHISDLSDVPILFILVDTTTPDGYAHDNVEAVLRAIDKLPGGRLVVLNSTCGPELFSHDRTVRPENPLVYNPLFVRQGNLEDDILKPDLVLIGDDGGHCLPLLALYRRIGLAGFHVMDRRSAAVAKLAINTFLTIKIAFANLIGDLCVKAGADPVAVLSATGCDSRINKRCLNYGDGFGGPCLPIDVRVMTQLLVEHRLPELLPAAAEASNALHLEFQLEQIVRGQPARNAVTVRGVAYKAGCDLIANSQRLAFALRLADQGYVVTIRDSATVIAQVRCLYGERFRYDADPM